MKRLCSFATAAALLLTAATAPAQSVVFDFEDGTDQGFGTGFGADASASFAIENVGGSQRMNVPRTAFQSAGREESNPASPFFLAMAAAAVNESLYEISYDWYADTSVNPGAWGSFLQIGTFVNAGSGDYFQDFPGTGKDVELDGTQLASGGVFSGTVTETFSAKGYDLRPSGLGPGPETLFRLGFIINGDGNSQAIHFDNIRVGPVIPEPASLGLAALAGIGIMAARRRGGYRSLASK
jgi:hypothetical protein